MVEPNPFVAPDAQVELVVSRARKHLAGLRGYALVAGVALIVFGLGNLCIFYVGWTWFPDDEIAWTTTVHLAGEVFLAVSGGLLLSVAAALPRGDDPFEFDRLAGRARAFLATFTAAWFPAAALTCYRVYMVLSMPAL